MIWSSLPEEPRRLYTSGNEKIFEYIEDVLLDMKLDGFESTDRINLFPIEDGLVKHFGCLVDVLKTHPEPGARKPTGEGNTGSQTTNSNFAKAHSPKAKAQKKSPGQPASRSAANDLKIVSALLAHHQKTDGRFCTTPLSVGELQRNAGVKSKSTVSKFMKKHFATDIETSGHVAYTASCRDEIALKRRLSRMDQNSPQMKTFGSTPPGERDRRESE